MVITLDKHKKPLGFTTEKRARKLMEAKRAVICRYFPTVIILMDRDARDYDDLPTYRIKIDPGSVHTGIAIVCNETNRVMYSIRIEHRAEEITKLLQARNSSRRNRRNRETPYRRSKWKNGNRNKRPSKEGCLPPSIKSIGDNIVNTVKKLRRFINITECSFEAVRFDSRLMDDPDIEGKQYQQGTLSGYELREYLLEHFRHTCQYCGGASGDNVLEWEHMIPKSRGGTDSVRNASLSCSSCNREKGAMTPGEWLGHLRNTGFSASKDKQLAETRIRHLEGILLNSTVYGSSRYSAWTNSLRKSIEKDLFDIFGEVECSSGGRTKYNREKILKLPKDHHIDALAVGSVPEEGYTDCTNGYVLHMTAMGRGTRLRGLINDCGMIHVKWTDRRKRFNGLQTGDIVRVRIPNGKYTGTYTGRVMIRKSGSHDIRTLDGELVTGTKRSVYSVLQHADGYGYNYYIGKIGV
ncbi:MAG: RRXRR domain-containing protein [Clostridia bacterium]|nr:RRXRR domain-containing protein [Clostridia bacterium]